MTFTVSEVARRTGVSVRTLHHYDEIGLLPPAGRSRSGYRLYGPADLERLQQILFFRELGFPLEEILRIMSDPAYDVGAALRTQRELLADRVVKVRALLDAVDAALARLEKGEAMSTDETTAAFEGFDHAKYEEEAERRWGDGDAYKESKRRTARYTKQDWEAIKAEAGAIYERLAALMEAGTPATAPEAMEAAEAHRRHVDRWFYPCPREQHRGLGQLYVDDARFTAFFDRIRPGLARYACDAFAANAAR
jgi:DNA-binding transcriptional MerR regulator